MIDCLIGAALLLGIPLGIVIFADVVTDVWMSVKDWVDDDN